MGPPTWYPKGHFPILIFHLGFISFFPHGTQYWSRRWFPLGKPIRYPYADSPFDISHLGPVGIPSPIPPRTHHGVNGVPSSCPCGPQQWVLPGSNVHEELLRACRYLRVRLARTWCLLPVMSGLFCPLPIWSFLIGLSPVYMFPA